MSDSWISVNLPWSRLDSAELAALVEEGTRFVEWYRSEYERRFGPYNCAPLSEDVDVLNQRAPELCQSQRFHEPAWLADIERLHPEDTNVLELARHRHRVGLSRVWEENDPTCIARTTRANEVKARHQAGLFSYHAACRPGVIIEMQRGEDTFTYVLGGVPERPDLGVDAEHIPSDGIVVRYRDLLAAADTRSQP